MLAATLLVLAAAAALPSAPPWLLPGEQAVFGFRTAEGKVCQVLRGPEGGYLVYRFGTEQSVELQFPPALDGASWGLFVFERTFRPGGAANLGLDLNQLRFENGPFEYTVFDDTSYEDGESRSVGVRYRKKLAKLQRTLAGAGEPSGTLAALAGERFRGRAAPAAKGGLDLVGAWSSRAGEGGDGWWPPSHTASFAKGGSGKLTVAAGYVSTFAWRLAGTRLFVREKARQMDTPEGMQAQPTLPGEQAVEVTRKGAAVCLAPKAEGLFPSGCILRE